ncbi:penicillin-binding protein 4-like [Mercenaria mercenaria]|uniref:penicillin-binding protein 4-like n=1 Tax=Mercenaria mercenaria TaxID=6596 RepID=UPI00234F980A|nr:penicillin-binding protein 4-like [Mercenaria mercenaria]
MDLHALFAGVIFAVFGLTLSLKDIDQAGFEQKVTSYIKAGMDCRNNPGLSLSVVKDGKILLAKGFGHKTLDRLEPVTNETIFGIASLSKAFAATLILKQIEENDSLSLSTQVRDILGRDDIFKDYLRSRYTTLEDLLAHRLGIPSNNNIRLDDTLTRKTFVDRLKFLSPKGGFRTSFYYSNLMYGLVTYISELIGGKSWENLVKEKIFDPLDMTSSTFVTTADLKNLENFAVGYQDRYGTLVPVPAEFSRRWGLLCGSGCVLSNALDMANWMIFHLNNGLNSKNVRVLDPDILDDAHKAQNSISYASIGKYYTRPLTPVTLSHSNYGLGWKLGHYRGFPIITHTGSTYGYRAMVTLIPGINAGFFTTLTGDDPSYFFRTNGHLYMADLLLGHEPWLDNVTVCSFPEPWKKKSDKPDAKPRTDIAADKPLSKYEGLFSNNAYGIIEIYLNDSSGFLMAKVGFGQFVLYPKSTADTFYAQGFDLLQNVRDFSTFQFSFKNEEVDILKIPSFESKDPPVFNRIQRKASDGTERPKRSNVACGKYRMNIFWYSMIILIIVIF